MFALVVAECEITAVFLLTYTNLRLQMFEPKFNATIHTMICFIFVSRKRYQITNFCFIIFLMSD